MSIVIDISKITVENKMIKSIDICSNEIQMQEESAYQYISYFSYRNITI